MVISLEFSETIFNTCYEFKMAIHTAVRINFLLNVRLRYVYSIS